MITSVRLSVCLSVRMLARHTRESRLNGSRYRISLRFAAHHKGEGKAEHLDSALHGKDHFKALRHGSHSFTCNKHHACLTS